MKGGEMSGKSAAKRIDELLKEKAGKVAASATCIEDCAAPAAVEDVIGDIKDEELRDCLEGQYTHAVWDEVKRIGRFDKVNPHNYHIAGYSKTGDGSVAGP